MALSVVQLGQDVEMSEPVPSHSTNPQVRHLATRIERAQGPEIEEMNDWLTKWVPRRAIPCREWITALCRE